MKTKIVLIVLLAFAAGFIPGCRKKAASVLPPSGAVAGWEKTGTTQTYTAENLWQYLDGGAEEYVSAGVVSAVTSDYKFQGNLEAVVDVYRMKSPSGAQKLLGTEPPSGQAVQVGDAARLYTQSLIFRKGTALVRITAYEPAPGESGALLSLAHGIEGRL